MDSIVIRYTALNDDIEMIRVNKFLWTNLLSELLKYILKYVGRGDLLQIRLVCKDWYARTHFKFAQKSKLIINLCNISTLRDIVQNDDECYHRIAYDSVEIHDIEINDDLQPILKRMGPKIHTLYLFRSPIFAILNDCLPNLKELRVRHISTVQRDDLVSLNLGKFKNLRALDIRCYSVSTDLTNDIILKLTQEETLQMEKLCVDLLHEQQENLVDVLHFHSKSLKHLEIHFRGYIGNGMEKKWKQAFAMLKHLEVLKITGVYFREGLSMLMNALPKEIPLRHFYLDRTSSLDLIKFIIKKWPRSLESMELINCIPEDNVDFKDLVNLRHTLRTLHIKNSSVQSVEGLLQGIVSEKNYVLKSLVYNNRQFCKNNVLQMQLLVQRLPNLTNLSLENNRESVDDTVLSCIFRHLLLLRHLNFNSCSLITDNGLLGFGPNPAPITNLRGLQSLNLCHCSAITDKSLECFKFIELRKLKFNYCNNISSKGIQEMVKNCPALEELTFWDCSLIDDETILHVARGALRLRRLNVDFCKRLTNKFIDYIVEFCKSLKELSMQSRTGLDNKENFSKLARFGISKMHNMEFCCFCT